MRWSGLPSAKAWLTRDEDGLPHLHVQAAPALAERQPLGERAVARQLVQLADELARLEVDEVVTALEAVELLQDDDGQRDVVLLEVVDAGVIEEDDVGVDHEELLHLPSRAVGTAGRRRRHPSRPAEVEVEKRTWGEPSGVAS